MFKYFVTLTILLEVQVFAEDPVFTNLDDVVTISDTATVGEVRTVSATDAETVSSSLVYYMTSSSLYFDFDTVTKKVTVADVLESGTYSLDFLVIDTSDASATGTLTVNVNNSITTITNLPASVSVREDAINETLLHTLETSDQSPNDTVTCSQTSGNDDFPVKQITGSTKYGIYLRAFPTSLNTSSATSLPLTIECTDSKSSVSGIFNVTVTENSRPTFQNLPHSVTVENSTTDVGTVVFTLTSVDLDDTQIFCNMTSDPDPCPFLIYDSGDVVTTGTLSESSYVISVYVYDGYSLVGPSTLNISISADVNDVPVIAYLPQTMQLSENAALGSSVYQVNVSDANSGQNHSFSAVYTPSSAASLFDVDVATGLISTSPTDYVDYESLTMTSVAIEVTVHDGTDNATSNLTIDINDVNEQPSFQHSVYYLSGDEGSAGASFGIPGFTVDDEDIADNHTYQLNCSQFQMNSSTTDVTLAVDYDLDQTGSASLVTCLATASDSEYTTTTTLSITVNYKNDHSPQFQSSNYTFSVDSSCTIGYSLGTVSAADSDLGDDGTVFYSLNQSSLSTEYFDVDNSGVVFVKNSLDEFTINGSTIICSAIVTDTVGPSATASVTIAIYASPTVNTTTATTTTTTTERYLTFIEDPKNAVWLTCFSGIGAVTTVMSLIVGYRNGVFQNLFQKAKDGCSRSDGGFDDDVGDENEDTDDSLEEYSNEDDNDEDGYDNGMGNDTGSSSPGSRNETVTTIGSTVDIGWNPWNNSTDL